MIYTSKYGGVGVRIYPLKFFAVSRDCTGASCAPGDIIIYNTIFIIIWLTKTASSAVI